jgi:hypothetical protein
VILRGSPRMSRSSAEMPSSMRCPKRYSRFLIVPSSASRIDAHSSAASSAALAMRSRTSCRSPDTAPAAPPPPPLALRRGRRSGSGSERHGTTGRNAIWRGGKGGRGRAVDAR